MIKHLFAAILFLSYLSAKAQAIDTTFKKEWIEINKLITEKKLPKSALVKVDALYKKAKAMNLPFQQVKTLMYKFSLEGEVSNKNVNEEAMFWKKELATATYKPAKAIIQLMLAKTYCDEYSRNEWKYNNRTETIAYKSDDVETWTKGNLATIIDSLLKAMLSETKPLQQVKQKELDAILIKGEVRELRPTLFDLLSFEAIDCYSKFIHENTEDDWSVDNGAFSRTPAFMDIHYEKKDTLNFINSCLQVFQHVLRFHENNKNQSAFIDANIQRIVWAKEHAQQDNKDVLYETALQEMVDAGGKQTAADEAWYLLAQLHKDKAATYKPNEDTANRFEKVAALQLINKRLQEQTTPSYGRTKLEKLKEEITGKFISSKLEAVNVPSQPFRLYVEYTNTDTLFYRVIRLHKKWELANDGIKYWYKIAKLPYLQQSFQPLPATHDHQQHAVELKMDALPIGSYMILASTGKDFVDSTDRLFNQFFEVSQLSYIQNGKDYFVLDRETGQPISNVSIEALANNWTNNKKETEVLASGKTDKNGLANFNKTIPSNQYNYSLQLIKGKDTLYSNNLYNYSNSYQNNRYKSAQEFEERNAKTFFFMDRSIYRPNQTVQFKALLTTNDSATGMHKLYLNKKSLKVYLVDVNDKKIDSIQTAVNTFGSINGSFKLPLNVLTGQFRISVKDLGQPGYFNVEEYKRPTFFVELNKQTSTYKLNDSIKLTGTVKAYAGNNLNNAKLSYTVNRNARFIPYWGWGKRSSFNPNFGGSKQIVQGNLITDENGKFELTFKAVPEELKEKDSSVVFDFSVNVAATDISGETREESSSISIGYKSLLLESAIDAIYETKELKDFPIETNNLSGQKVAAKVQVKIVALETPKLSTRKRYWDSPDQFVLTEAEYKKYFPYDAYTDEDDYTKWNKLNLVDEGSINTKRDSIFTLHKSLPQGWYAIDMIATDSLGNETKNSFYTQVYAMDANALPAPSNEWEQRIKTVTKVGDTASLLIGSSLQDVYLIANTKRKKGNELVNQTEEDSYQFFQLNNNKKLWQQTITAADRKGLGMFYAFVKHNRFYHGGTAITVPYDNKQLDINYASYRNKTEPGSKETWSIKIKGSKNEKAAAELVTAMYDASLDQFNAHSWNEPNIWNNYVYFRNNWQQGKGFDDISSNENAGRYFDWVERDKYDRLAENGAELWVLHPWNDGYKIGTINLRGKLAGAISGLNATMQYDLKGKKQYAGTRLLSMNNNGDGTADVTFNYSPMSNGNAMTYFTAPNIVMDSTRVAYPQDELFVNAERLKKNSQPIQPRKNFNETAFFFPNLYADTAGNYTFSFTIPEALTQWKWLSFAHTKDLAFGTNSTTITTQKTLMVQPNAPRFMREGDNMEFVAKVSNLSDKELTGQATLELVDAVTGTSVDGWFQNVFPNQYFTVAAGQSAAVKFPIQIPFSYNKPLTWRVVARAGEFSDGEENTLPVLTNRMLVTETLPLYLKPGEKEKSFTFDKLLNNKSESLTHEGITVEYTANPIWSVVQSLPYLMEYPYECAEQTFNRFYANALAASIVGKHPTIKAMFEKWKNDTTALKSNLSKNEELKQVLLQETPWVLNAESEEQQKKNIALLFDVVKMGSSIESITEKLKQMQMPSGGFAWFKGGREDRYITNYILTGIGKLKQLNALTQEQADKLMPIFKAALGYVDNELQHDYDNLKKSKLDMGKQQIYSTQIQYLYMRSAFVTEIKNREAYNYYYNQAKQYWNKQNSYHTAMIGLVLYRNNERRFVNVNILPSITENAVEDTIKGTVYWKDRSTCFWYASPIEHQSMMIEFLNEVAAKESMFDVARKVDAAKTWLILNKQTNSWKTTIATADACYALLNTGSNWINNNHQQVQIKLGNQQINTSQQDGYIKQRIGGDKVKPSMGSITVTTNQPINQLTNQPSFGSVYWQYFEDLDKITESASPLSIKKKIFIERNSDKGKVLELVSDTNQLKVGDRLVIRMELITDREMEYLHLKDMRASGTEPVNVLSSYKWQEGLGYYEATKDASTNFFIDKMQKGTYVFEYPLYVTHTGTFSVGIATIQCMYAPEFTSHSEGIKITVKE